MLFFNDEGHNKDAVSKMGITSIFMGNGVNLGALRQGLSKFSQNHSPMEGKKQRQKSLKKSSSSETEE
ncbi:Protein-tyrosine-phosphatase [Handroanthus impetiginosus]|uniref:Protein-tyrosine-phosphatase n=1 Tax=Handroanthus impetiginosus TaxID=429701 RepID=A0A2G9HSG7_9LAMI|nr:Protein-tyrosine-phosphatase [Handroanthus impetiginosus]